MNYKVKAIPKFEKELKRLAKKHSSLKAEYLKLIKGLEENPQQGTSLGANCFKLRVALRLKVKVNLEVQESLLV